MAPVSSLFFFYEISNIMAQNYAVSCLPQIIQKQINDSTKTTFVSY